MTKVNMPRVVYRVRNVKRRWTATFNTLEEAREHARTTLDYRNCREYAYIERVEHLPVNEEI